VRQDAEVALAYSTILAEQTDLSVLSPHFKVSPNCALYLAGSNTFYYIGGYNRVRLYFRFIYIKAPATMQPCN